MSSRVDLPPIERDIDSPEIREAPENFQRDIFDDSSTPSIAPIRTDTPHSGVTHGHQPESEFAPEGNLNLDNNLNQAAPLPPSVIPDPNIAPDPPPPLDLDNSDDELVTERVLFCAVCPENHQEDLFDWTVDMISSPQESSHLAEDGLPLVTHPLTCEPEQCSELEIPLSRSDLLHWAQAEQPEELSYVATCAEVHVKDLTSKEKALFDVAKAAELTCWIQTSALQPVLRRHLNQSDPED